MNESDRGHRPQLHVTYEVTFPTGLSFATATRLLGALGGLDRPAARQGSPFSWPIVVFEVLAVPGRIRHFISCWPHLADTVVGNLRGVLPDAGCQPAELRPRHWNAIVELEVPAHVRETKGDVGLVATLLSSLHPLEPDEAILLQFVTTPRGPLEMAGRSQLFDVVGRIAATGPGIRPRVLVRRVLVPYRNLQVRPARSLPPQLVSRVTYRAAPLLAWPTAMTADELALAWGMPIGSPQVPGLVLGRGKRLAPEPHVPAVGRQIGLSNFLGAERPVALSPADRHKHLYLIGPTGTGKSTIMENLAVADMHEGEGLVFIDPKGHSIERLLDRVPPHRQRDVILYDLADPDMSIGFNILEGEQPHVIAGQLVTVFGKVFDLTAAPRAMNILRPTLLTLAQQGFSLCEVPVILEPSVRGRMFRAQAMARVADPELLNFWHQFDSLTTREQTERTDAILHRVSALLLYPQLRASLGQRRSGFDMNQAVGDKRILLVPLPTETIPDEMARLVGSLITMKLWNAVRTRRPHQDFFLYMDEFEEVAQLPISLGQMFSQSRGFRLGIILGHQHVDQLPVPMRSEVFSNVRNKLALQLEMKDARILAEQFGETVRPQDLVNLGPFEAFARLASGGSVTQPFTLTTLPPTPFVGATEGAWGQQMRRDALARWGRPTADVLRDLEVEHGDRSGRASTLLPQTPIGWEEVVE